MALESFKVTMCWPNRIEEATLTGGAWDVEFPITNVQDFDRAVYASSQDTLLANTQFLISFPQRRTTGCVALQAHTISVDGLVRITARDDADATLYQSEWLDAWPAVHSYETLAWQDDNWWSGKPTNAERNEYPALFVHIFEPVENCHSVLVEISDPDNPDGVVQIGRAFASQTFQPDDNVSWGLSWGFEDDSDIIRGRPGGPEFYNEGVRRRTLTFDFGRLTAEEAFNRLAPASRTLGITGEILVAQNLFETPQAHERRMIGRISSIDAISYPYINNFQSAIAMQEII